MTDYSAAVLRRAASDPRLRNAHPLAPFCLLEVDAPYHTRDLAELQVQFKMHGYVEPYAPRTGLARGTGVSIRYVHRVAAMARFEDEAGVRLGTRWLCGTAGSMNVVEVENAEGYEDCPRCAVHGERPAVYWIYDDVGEVIYIGASRQPSIRVQQHQTSRNWRHEIASFRFEHHPDMDAAFRAETAAIAAENPVYNLPHDEQTAARKAQLARRAAASTGEPVLSRPNRYGNRSLA